MTRIGVPPFTGSSGPAGTGSVTLVATGTNLVGGTITTAGTISMAGTIQPIMIGTTNIQGGTISGVYIDDPSDMFGQVLVNGNLDVWQRGTSFSSIAAYTKLADRWYGFRQSGAAGMSVTQQTGTAVNGAQYCARIQRDNANTAVTDLEFWYKGVLTEDAVKYRGDYLNLSFYARSGANFSSSGTQLVCGILGGKGTNQTPESYTTATDLAIGTVTLTTAFQRFSVTTAATVASDITEFTPKFTYTPVGTAGAADYYEITGIKLSKGIIAQPLQIKNKNRELQDCYYYFYRLGGDSQYHFVFNTGYSSTTTIENSEKLPVPMRTIPTISFGGARGTDWIVQDGSGNTNTSGTQNLGLVRSNYVPEIAFTSGTYTANGGYHIQLLNTALNYIDFSSEL